MIGCPKASEQCGWTRSKFSKVKVCASGRYDLSEHLRSNLYMAKGVSHKFTKSNLKNRIASSISVIHQSSVRIPLYRLKIGHFCSLH